MPLGVLLDIATSPASAPAAVDFTWLFVKMLAALGAVCVIAILVVRYLVPRMGVIKRFSGNRYMEILGRHSLDARRHLYIIKIGGRYALIGSSEHGVGLVMELKEEDLK
jgi:flagellar biogenesis protein FliO